MVRIVGALTFTQTLDLLALAGVSSSMEWHGMAIADGWRDETGTGGWLL
jgi:hypothetical protein